MSSAGKSSKKNGKDDEQRVSGSAVGKHGKSFSQQVHSVHGQLDDDNRSQSSQRSSYEVPSKTGKLQLNQLGFKVFNGSSYQTSKLTTPEAR